MRTMVGNMKTILSAAKLNNEYRVAKGGSIVPNTFRNAAQPAQPWDQNIQSQNVQSQIIPPVVAHSSMVHGLQPDQQMAQHQMVQPMVQSVQQTPQTQNQVPNMTLHTQQRPQYAPNYSIVNTYANATRPPPVPPPVSTQLPVPAPPTRIFLNLKLKVIPLRAIIGV